MYRRVCGANFSIDGSLFNINPHKSLICVFIVALLYIKFQIMSKGYNLTGIPFSLRYSFTVPTEYSLKWKILAAKAASALPFVNAS